MDSTPKDQADFPLSKAEPEQLELFASIANAACGVYVINSDDCVSVRNQVLKRCIGTNISGGFWSNLGADYLNGAAMALNPFPPSTAFMGSWASDRLALFSDWQVVQNDMNVVWQGISIADGVAGNVANERSGQSNRRTKTETDAG